MNKLAYILIYLENFFSGNKDSVEKWLNTPNRNFKGRTPQELIDDKKINEVYNFIRAVKGGKF